MDDVMNASREFFHLPLEEKRKYSNLVDGKRFQVEGYGNDQVKAQDQILDWSDRLHLKVEPRDERNLANWPRHPENFMSVCTILKQRFFFPLIFSCEIEYC